MDLTFDDLTDLTEQLKMIGDIVSRKETDPKIQQTKADEVSFTAKIMTFDDTFRSDEADPIWGLAFTSKDITR